MPDTPPPPVAPRGRIFAFSNTPYHGSDGDYVCMAMAEDGHVLAEHLCSHPAYGPHDLGVNVGEHAEGSTWKHEYYAKHYPQGFDVEWIPINEVLMHEGLKAAYEKNQQLRMEASRAE